MIGAMVEMPLIVGVAFEVLADKYGINEERVKKLKQAGYDPDKVQKCVNDLLKLFNKYM